MAKKSASPLTGVKRPRSAPYTSDFESLKAQVLADARAGARTITHLPIERLCRGRYQPRIPVEDQALLELADSIRALGIIEPIVVRPLADQAERYEILAGDRRWRAAQRAGLEQVPVVVHDVDERTAAAIALVENLQRTDLNPLEQATALRRLMEDFQLTQTQVAELVGKSESAVSKALGLLKLAPRVQALIRQGVLDAGHGKVLLSVSPEQQVALAEQAARHGWSVRELERHKAALSAPGRRRTIRPAIDPNLKDLETRLGEWFCAPVRIKPLGRSGGRIEIRYASAAECAGILHRFGFRKEDD